MRLELARTFFLKGDYDNADRQFRFARAGDIDDTVKANIDHFLDAINRFGNGRSISPWRWPPTPTRTPPLRAPRSTFSALPFALDKNARKQSGIGVAGDIGGEWSPPLSDNLKARVGGDLTRTDYSGGQFDDMTLSGYAGPQFVFHDWDFSVLGTGFQRWYANQDYLSGFGGKIAADYGITSDLLISAASAARR